jgi:hypothetical protein
MDRVVWQGRLEGNFAVGQQTRLFALHFLHGRKEFCGNEEEFFAHRKPRHLSDVHYRHGGVVDEANDVQAM